jgi:hypothetical protein
MPHLIRDVAEEVLRDFLLSKVFRLETGKERSSSTKLAGRLRLTSLCRGLQNLSNSPRRGFKTPPTHHSSSIMLKVIRPEGRRRPQVFD